MKPPCKDCPKRAAGCAVSCEKWREYAAEKMKIYAKKDESARLRDYYSEKKLATLHRKYRSKRR